MNGDDRFGFFSDLCLDLRWIYRVKGRKHVHEHRLRADLSCADGAGYPGQRRDEDLVAGSYAEGAECEFQCVRPITAPDAMLKPGIGSEFLLKNFGVFSGNECRFGE